MSALPPDLRENFATAAREFRGDPPLAKPDTTLVRALFLDAIGPVPAEALAAFVAADLGDDDEAYERMKIVVDCVRRAAKLFKTLRRAEGEVSE